MISVSVATRTPVILRTTTPRSRPPGTAHGAPQRGGRRPRTHAKRAGGGPRGRGGRAEPGRNNGARSRTRSDESARMTRPSRGKRDYGMVPSSSRRPRRIAADQRREETGAEGGGNSRAPRPRRFRDYFKGSGDGPGGGRGGGGGERSGGGRGEYFENQAATPVSGARPERRQGLARLPPSAATRPTARTAGQKSRGKARDDHEADIQPRDRAPAGRSCHHRQQRRAETRRRGAAPPGQRDPARHGADRHGAARRPGT